MTDLTKDWKDGKLPAGRYWVKYRSGRIDDWDLLGGKTIETKPEIVEVLAEIPDYVEWRNMVNCACEEHEANKRFIEENQQLKDVISKMCMELVDPDDDMSNGLADYFNQDLLLEIHEVLK